MSAISQDGFMLLTYSNEEYPEELDAFALENIVLVPEQHIEHLNGRDQVREDAVGRIHQEGAHHSCETISKELRTQKSEDGYRRIRRESVVEVVSSENVDLRCESVQSNILTGKVTTYWREHHASKRRP